MATWVAHCAGVSIIAKSDGKSWHARFLALRPLRRIAVDIELDVLHRFDETERDAPLCKLRYEVGR